MCDSMVKMDIFVTYVERILNLVGTSLIKRVLDSQGPVHPLGLSQDYCQNNKDFSDVW